MDVAIIGGTGEEGFGLALRLGRAGHRVVIGSRSEEKGAGRAADAREILGAGAEIDGTTNEAAAESCEVVFVTVPFAGQADIYRAIKKHVAPGKVVCDATSPLATAVGGRAWHVVRPWHGSAAEQAAAIVNPAVRMTAAFHTISAEQLNALDTPMDSDVLVCGDDPEAKAIVGGLVDQIPDLRWVDAGLLSQARIVETLTALLVSINRGYKVRDSGFRITGRDRWGAPGS
jgi:NADPH-dependent F420 reductase